tara:strand:+ start:7830 stop:8975 length:1146 start_codon:yes stop_codon:yes gene_type:complete
MYKAFEDYYKDESIKHLILHDWNGTLVSPPFATEKCRDYSNLMFLEKGQMHYIKLDLPEATSKTNALANIGNSLWFVPYAIYDKFNQVVEVTKGGVNYFPVDISGKGQYYSIASNGDSAFSFPLGYTDESFGLYIRDGQVIKVDLAQRGLKLHMGTVWCNDRYFSMPRGDEPGYNYLLSFNGKDVEKYEVPYINKNITRKFTDCIVVGNKLFALPFGETAGVNCVVEFDTETNTFATHNLQGIDFAKKYNAGVLLGKTIIALPYGDEHVNDSNLGLKFDTITGQSDQFKINQSFGGKYRFRCGIKYYDEAYFFPSGTPACPILVINKDGQITNELHERNVLFGRPIVFNDLIHVIKVDLTTKSHKLCIYDRNLQIVNEQII